MSDITPTTAERLAALETRCLMLTTMLTASLNSQRELIATVTALTVHVEETTAVLDNLDGIIGRMQRAKIDEALARIDEHVANTNTWSDKADFDESLATEQP